MGGLRVEWQHVQAIVFCCFVLSWAGHLAVPLEHRRCPSRERAGGGGGRRRWEAICCVSFTRDTKKLQYITRNIIIRGCWERQVHNFHSRSERGKCTTSLLCKLHSSGPVMISHGPSTHATRNSSQALNLACTSRNALDKGMGAPR